MAYNYEFPYRDAELTNLDWLIKSQKEVVEAFDKFVVMNEVKYAEPIQWSIDTQYEKNTIVQDHDGEKTYLSKQPVPSGINITNTDYWLQLADYEPEWSKIRTQLFKIDLGTTSIAPFDITQDTILWHHGYLRKATTYIYTGDTLRDGVNLTPITLQDILDAIETEISSYSGAISNLQTGMTNLQGSVGTNTTNITALQIKSNVIVKDITLYAVDWVGSQITINDADITATSIQVLTPRENISASLLGELQDANIQSYAQSVGSITLVAFGTLPTNDLPCKLLIYKN